MHSREVSEFGARTSDVDAARNALAWNGSRAHTDRSRDLTAEMKMTNSRRLNREQRQKRKKRRKIAGKWFSLICFCSNYKFCLLQRPVKSFGRIK